MVRTLNPDRRKSYLSAALQLFVANGVQHTSTAEIAKAAGTAAGTLFLYFPTKQDLLHALVLKISQEQSEAIYARLDPSLSARETFFAIWQGSIQWFMENMDAYRYVQQIRDSGMIAESVVQQSNQFLAYYYAAIEKGLQQGSIEPYAAELIGSILYQQMVAILNLIQAQPDAAQRDRYIAQGFEIFWNGIKTHPRAAAETVDER